MKEIMQLVKDLKIAYANEDETGVVKFFIEVNKLETEEQYYILKAIREVEGEMYFDIAGVKRKFTIETFRRCAYFNRDQSDEIDPVVLETYIDQLETLKD